MTKQEVVDYAKVNITDWKIGSTNYGLGDFNVKSLEIPVAVFQCTSVNNARWEWTHDSYISWGVAVEIITLIKKFKKKRFGKERIKKAVGVCLLRKKSDVEWSLKQ